jgi:hypothetical protein
MSRNLESALSVIGSPTCLHRRCCRFDRNAHIVERRFGWRRGRPPVHLNSVSRAPHTSGRAQRGGLNQCIGIGISIGLADAFIESIYCLGRHYPSDALPCCLLCAVVRSQISPPPSADLCTGSGARCRSELLRPPRLAAIEKSRGDQFQPRPFPIFLSGGLGG